MATHPRSTSESTPATPFTAARTLLAGAELGCLSDAERIDALRALEELKATAAAVQASLAVDLDTSQRAEQRQRGVPTTRQGQGVGTQVGLARRESPHRGGILLGLAKILVAEMPHTHAAMRAGALSEYRAQLIVQETACLTREGRTRVDELVCADPENVGSFSTRKLVAHVKTLCYELEPLSVVERHRRAPGERHVSLRPAPDGMTWLSALLPLVQGVAVHKALTVAATSAKACGDERSKGNIMADTLVERVTGQTHAGGVPITINLVMTDRALIGTSTTPALIEGGHPFPAEVARDLILASPNLSTFLRRLYTDDGGRLVAIESKARLFPEGLARFIHLRDHGCQNPFCGAPVRHIDHVIPHEHGGPTSSTNGQGLCQTCNHTKQAPDWFHHPAGPGGRPRQPRGTLRTPTGHTYPMAPHITWPRRQ